jgi:hypothetical protein
LEQMAATVHVDTARFEQLASALAAEAALSPWWSDASTN